LSFQHHSGGACSPHQTPQHENAAEQARQPTPSERVGLFQHLAPAWLSSIVRRRRTSPLQSYENNTSNQLSMRRLYVCLALTVLCPAAVLLWWFRSPSLPTLPPLPRLRNAPGDAFALGVIGHTNDASGNEYIAFFFANPKDDVAFLTPTATERYDSTGGQWTSVPYESHKRLKIAPGATRAFYLPRAEGESPWRVVLTYSPQQGSVDTLMQTMQTNTPANQLEFRTPILIGANIASKQIGTANGSQPFRSETNSTSSTAGSRR
jgi:hypothetical protein